MSFDALIRLMNSTGGIFRENEPLAPFTSLKIGGRALFYVKPRHWGSVPEVLGTLHELGLPCRVLGRGTNLLVSDGDLGFGVLHILRMDGSVKIEEIAAAADADVLLGELCRESFQNSLTGLETLEMIPGSVGGAVVMNAGAYGKSVFNFIRSVTVLGQRGEEITMFPDQIEVGYRHTNVKEFGLVRKISMSLKKGVRRDIDIKAREYQRKRNESQPWKSRTAGSVFKNPEGESAGRILEELGFRGKTRGDACFSPMHSNFLVNSGSASFADAFSLAEEARLKALSRGYRLEYEMEVWNSD